MTMAIDFFCIDHCAASVPSSSYNSNGDVLSRLRPATWRIFNSNSFAAQPSLCNRKLYFFPCKCVCNNAGPTAAIFAQREAASPCKRSVRACQEGSKTNRTYVRTIGRARSSGSTAPAPRVFDPPGGGGFVPPIPRPARTSAAGRVGRREIPKIFYRNTPRAGARCLSSPGPLHLLSPFFPTLRYQKSEAFPVYSVGFLCVCVFFSSRFK